MSGKECDSDEMLLKSEKSYQYTKNTIDVIEKEHLYGCHNYHPLPVVLVKGKGVFVWDIEGNRYYDFLSGYSAINQGHCHPKIMATVAEQIQNLTLTSRAFYSLNLSKFEEYCTKLFKYDKLLPMNSGCEAAESAVKLARKWGYRMKGIKENEAIVLFPKGNFWGRSIAACSASTDPLCYSDYGPYVPKFEIIPYNDLEALEDKCKNPNVCAFMFEPIQGEAGVVLPDDGYLVGVRNICTKYNVLMIADEIQTGLGRTGRMLCCDHENVKPDILVLGKALSGGFYPLSAVLANNEIMDVIEPGTHGSTYGGNPLASAIGVAAIQAIIDDKMIENSHERGMQLRSLLSKLPEKVVKTVRGKGLLNAIVIQPEYDAFEICIQLRNNGLLAKHTHVDRIRLCPPLCITEEQVDECGEIVSNVISQFVKT